MKFILVILLGAVLMSFIDSALGFHMSSPKVILFLLLHMGWGAAIFWMAARTARRL